MDIIKQVAEHTQTDYSEWEFSEGPETGVGEEYWLFNAARNLTVYVCIDQDEITSLQVQGTEDDGEETYDEDDGLVFEDDEV